MSLTNPNSVVTEQRLKDFYDGIFPYLGGKAEAGFTPVGTVISVMGISAPANYLACDGTVYNIVDYPELATYFYQQFGSKNKFGGDGTTTFAVPDLRGEFLRGTGTNGHTDQGSGANVGVHQDATMINQYFTDNNNHIVARFKSNTDWMIPNGDASVPKGEAKYLTIDATSGTSSSVLYATTTRPTNTSVLYCIATKNIYLNPSLDYSTTEKIVGTWTDGKPIYQKTLSGTIPTPSVDFGNVALDYIDVSSLNIDTITKMENTSISSTLSIVCSGVYTTRNGVDGTVGITSVFYQPNNNRLAISNNRTAFGGMTMKTTIQYTKTTD